MNALRRADVLALALLLGVATTDQGVAQAQEPGHPEEIVRGYFEGRDYYAAARASSTCPGDDSLNDIVVGEFMRPRSEEETRRLATGWAYVPPCRAEQVLAWYEREAIRVVTGEVEARSLARRVVRIDEGAGLRLLRRAAADPSVPDEARGAYQSAVYFRLSRAEQEALFIETFQQELQAGRYRRTGMQHVFGGPDAAATAVRILSEVLERPENDQASYILGVVLNIATIPEGFGPEDRQRIWDLLEPHLGSLPPEMRRAAESYETALRMGSG